MPVLFFCGPVYGPAFGCFKAVTGHSQLAFQRHMRVLEARKLLASGSSLATPRVRLEDAAEPTLHHWSDGTRDQDLQEGEGIIGYGGEAD